MRARRSPAALDAYDGKARDLADGVGLIGECARAELEDTRLLLAHVREPYMNDIGR